MKKGTSINSHTTVKHSRLLKDMWRDRYLYLLLIPGLLTFLLFKYLPMFWLTISFQDYKVFAGIGGSEWVGFKHYIDFFQSRDFFMLLKNTLLLNFYSIIFEFPMPLIFALMLNEVKNNTFKRTIQTVSYMPHFISVVIMVSMVSGMLSPTTGIINKVIASLGGDPIFFMGKEKYFRTVFVGSGIWQNMGWQAIIYLAALTGIDPGLYEAAIVDGASKTKRLIHITLPSIVGTIVIMLIMRIGKLMTVGFEKAFLMGSDNTRQVSEVISTYVYKKGILNNDYSFATAVGLFNSLVSFLLVWTSNTVSRKLTDQGLW